MLLPAAAVQADDGVFALGRLNNSRPDAMRRIGIKVSCLSQAGCKLELILRTTAAKPVELGRVYTQIIGGTTEVDYVMLSRRMVALLGKRPTTVSVFTANVTVSGADVSSYKKTVLLHRPRPVR